MNSHYQNVQDLFKKYPKSKYVLMITLSHSHTESVVYVTSDTPNLVLTPALLKGLEEQVKKDAFLPNRFVITNSVPVMREPER